MGKQRLSGQRALVTGASSGIGAELARRLAREGANLVITARREERLEALAAELREAHGVEVVVLASDLSDPAAPEALFQATEGSELAVDVLVNNAGFGAYLDFVDVDWSRYAGMIQLNITALTQLMHLFVPKMVERRHGYVMNVASTGAYLPCPTFAVYAATKAYVRNLSEAVGYELKGTGVKTISVNPGPTRTEFMDNANQKLKGLGEAGLMSAATCADIAVRKMLAGRRNVVTGLLNALSMWIMRFIPRAMYPWLADVFMSAGVESVKPAALPAPSEGKNLPGPR